MRALLVSLLVSMAALSGCRGDSPPTTPLSTPAIEASEPFVEVRPIELRGPQGDSVTVDVWIADTPERRALGLMHRPELPNNAGMLFVFQEDNQGGFWMKNTLIPLSIAYIGVGGQVLALLDMPPCADDPCPIYDPGLPYRYALEVNQGWFDANGVSEEWRLDVSFS